MKGSVRSEEHTSELQSRSDLVCRLLLEKKKEVTFKRLAGHDSSSVSKHPRGFTGICLKGIIEVSGEDVRSRHYPVLVQLTPSPFGWAIIYLTQQTCSCIVLPS